MNYKFTCEPPSRDIYKFNGLFEYIGCNEDNFTKIGLTEDNCIWANSKITSGEVEGLIIYTGNQTKLQMNTNQARQKTCKIDLEINKLLKVTIFIMVVICGMMVLLKGINNQWPLFFTRYLILFS